MSNGINHAVLCRESDVCLKWGSHKSDVRRNRNWSTAGPGRGYIYFFFTPRVARNIPTQSGSTVCPKQTAQWPLLGRNNIFSPGPRRKKTYCRARSKIYLFFFLFCFLTATALLSAGYACGEVISGGAGEHLYSVCGGEGLADSTVKKTRFMLPESRFITATSDIHHFYFPYWIFACVCVCVFALALSTSPAPTHLLTPQV